MATHLGITKATLDMSVNTNPPNTGPYYHGTSFRHSVNPRRPKSDWDTDDAPLMYKCKGKCSDYYRSPYGAFITHRAKCGTGRDINKEAQFLYSSADNNTIIAYKANRLAARSVDEGCGRSYYKCPSYPDHSDVQRHKVRKCNKWVYTYDSHFSNRYTRTKCPKSYRKCMGHTYDHNNRVVGKSAHSDEGDSSNDETSSGLTTTPTPSYHTCGVHASSVSGSHNAAGCGTTGHYVCDNKTHTAAVCGTSGHYNCDNKNHSMQVTCTTHSTCDVINFYACDDHDPAVTCDAGHTYNPTRVNLVNKHRTRTCRYSNCGQTWQKCVSSAPICNKPYRKRNGLSCWAID